MDLEQRVERAEEEAERQRVALAISRSDALSGSDPLPSNLEEAADALLMERAELIEVLNNREFLKTVRGVTKARASLALHGPGVSKLLEVIEKGKHRDALQAIQILGRISGDLKAGQTVEVRVSFEELRQQQAGNGSSIGDLFEIKGEVIEGETAEPEDEDDDANRDTV